MVWQSIVFMLWMCLGAYQVIASWTNLRGMSFFGHPFLGYLFGAGMILGSFVWFFMTVEFYEGGPEGQHDEQFVSFALGGVGALLLTWGGASLRKAGPLHVGNGEKGSPEGIEAFRNRTFVQIVRSGRGESDSGGRGDAA